MDKVWSSCPRCNSKNVSHYLKTAGVGKIPEVRQINKCNDCGKLRAIEETSWGIKRLVNDHLEGYFDI